MKWRRGPRLLLLLLLRPLHVVVPCERLARRDRAAGSTGPGRTASRGRRRAGCTSGRSRGRRLGAAWGSWGATAVLHSGCAGTAAQPVRKEAKGAGAAPNGVAPGAHEPRAAAGHVVGPLHRGAGGAPCLLRLRLLGKLRPQTDRRLCWGSTAPFFGRAPVGARRGLGGGHHPDLIPPNGNVGRVRRRGRENVARRHVDGRRCSVREEVLESVGECVVTRYVLSLL